jgi:hypothetical protein
LDQLEGPGPASPTRGVVGDDGELSVSDAGVGLGSKRLRGLMDIVIPFRSFNDGKSGILISRNVVYPWTGRAFET